MTLPNKYRPKELKDMIGNETLKKTVESLLDRDDVDRPHAFLLTGPSGCGKTTLGRIIAAWLGAYIPGRRGQPNFTEMDSADFRGIDVIRDLRSRIRLAPLGHGEYRVYLLDEVHQITKDAQEALLKALEDTPRHVVFILCTTNPDKLKTTLKQRCTALAVSTADPDELTTLLEDVCEKEGVKVDRDVIDLIVQNCDFAPRLALSLLDRIIDLETPDDMKKALKKSFMSEAVTRKLANVLIKKENWATIREVLVSIKGEDPERIRRGVLGYCQAILLKKHDDYAAHVLQVFMEPVYDSGFPGIVGLCYALYKGE